MARKTRTKKQSADLPGTIYLNKNRYWWKVQLPGEDNPKARPLKPVGSRYATTDCSVAVECAKQLLQQHLFERRIPHDGDIKIIPDLVRAYMTFAEAYYLGPDGEPTREPLDIQYALAVLLDCFPSLAVEEFGPLTETFSMDSTANTSIAAEPDYANMPTDELVPLVIGIYEIVDYLENAMEENPENEENMADMKDFLEDVLDEIKAARQ